MNSDRSLGKKAINIAPLVASVIAYTLIITYLSFLRYENFFTTNWDFGIALQMMWTNTHGYLLFETADHSLSGGVIMSFLQVHSSYIAVPLSFLYYFAPEALTLLSLQSVVVGLTAIPIYLIGRQVLKKSILVYSSIAVFYLSFALISGILYDFHWESFIPLEFFSNFYFLMVKRYRYALATFIIGCLTLEVFPFLMMGMVLYFGYEEFGVRLFDIPRMLRNRRWLILLGLFMAAIVSYLLIRFFEFVVIPHALGVSGASGTSVAGSVRFLFLSTSNLTALHKSLSYWALLYVSLAFIPLLYPKHLIIAFPWLYLTIFLQPHFATLFGNQYGIIALVSVYPGFILGLRRLVTPSLSGRIDLALLPGLLTLIGLAVAISIYGVGSREILSHPLALQSTLLNVLLLVGIVLVGAVRYFPHITKLNWKRGVVFPKHNADDFRKVLIVLLVICCIGFNISLSPLSPANSSANPNPGYTFSFTSNPSFNYMAQITAHIPHDATIVASDNLFPFVANDPNAYSFLWYYPAPDRFFLPYNSSNLPQFALVDASQLSSVTPYFQKVLFQNSTYGLKDFIYSDKYPGSIYLFEIGYGGSSSYYYPTLFQPDSHFSPDVLITGKSGSLQQDNTSMFNKVIDSRAYPNGSGSNTNIWYGPYVPLVPGQYTVTLSLKGYSYNNSSGSTPLLYMDGSGFGSPVYYSTVIQSGSLSASTWTNFTFNFSIRFPYPDNEFRGYLLYPGGDAAGFVSLNYIALSFHNTYNIPVS